MGYIITLRVLLKPFTTVQVVADFGFGTMRCLLFVLHIVLRPVSFHIPDFYGMLKNSYQLYNGAVILCTGIL